MPIIVSVGLLQWGAMACGVEQAPRPQETATVPLADQESWHSTLTNTNMGRLTARIEFGHMLRYDEKEEYQFDQGVAVDFYDRTGRRSSWLKSDRGSLNELKRIMRAEGHVVAYSDSADLTLYTEALTWDENRDKILSDEAVTLTTEQDTLYGVGFESRTDLSEWVIKNPRGHTRRAIDWYEPGQDKKQ